MAGTKNQKIARLSVHPQFASRIMSGEKRIEFRKVNFAEKVTHVVVYATAPVGKILGYFEVESVDVDKVNILWSRYSSDGGISKNAFFEYFGDSRKGVAIGVGNTFVCSKPMNLSNLSKSTTPPQNFIYLEKTQFDRIRKCSTSTSRAP